MLLFFYRSKTANHPVATNQDSATLVVLVPNSPAIRSSMELSFGMEVVSVMKTYQLL